MVRQWSIHIGKKLIYMLLLVTAASLLTFLLMKASPVDPLQANVGQAALGSMSREQVEKAEWIWSTGDVYTCSSCGEKTHVDECMGNPIYNFCPFCMAPMTDEAVEMVIERWEALNDGKGD